MKHAPDVHVGPLAHLEAQMHVVVDQRQIVMFVPPEKSKILKADQKGSSTEDLQVCVLSGTG